MSISSLTQRKSEWTERGEILHVISDQARRGAQTFAVQLVSELNNQWPAVSSRLVALEPSSGVTWPVTAIGTRARGASTILRLRREFSNATVVVAHGSTTLSTSAIAGIGKLTPWIYRTIGDPTVWGAAKGAQVRIGVPMRRAAAVSALYEAARNYLVDRYRLNPGKVVTIPNAVPLFDLPSRADREQAHAQLGLSSDLQWVSFVGSLTAEKGILQAVRAVATDKDLGLLVAGGGIQRSEAIELADSLAPGRVRFLGVTDTPLQVMAASDALVIPSSTEGIPGVAIEAGLSGIPIVATNVGGLSELVLDGVTGVLIDGTGPDEITSGLRTALANAERMGAAGREHCRKRYTMENVATIWKSLIQNVVDEAS